MTSTPCGKSELMLFSKPIQQVSTMSGSWVDYHPVSSLQDSPIEFHISPSSNDYLDLNDTVLILKLKILHENKAVTKANHTNIAPVNLIHSSLFQDVEVLINGTQVEGVNSLYAYKSYMLTMLEFDKDTKNTQCRAAGYFKDESGEFDLADNSGHKSRSTWVHANNIFEVAGPLWVDVFHQPRYILPGIDLRIKLIPHDPKFYIMNFVAGTVKCIVESAVLYIRRVRVAQPVMNGHEIGLAKSNAIYPINRIKMQSFTVAQGSTSFSRDDIFPSQMPKLVYIALVDNSALNGDYQKNPFNFKHYKCTYISLFRNGQSIPIPAHTPNFTKGLFTQSYIQLIQSTEQYNKNANNGITMNDFAHGTCIFAFNLSPDLEATNTHQQIYQSGNIRLDMRFAEALGHSINVVILAIFDSRIEVTANRTVLKDEL